MWKQKVYACLATDDIAAVESLVSTSNKQINFRLKFKFTSQCWCKLVHSLARHGTCITRTAYMLTKACSFCMWSTIFIACECVDLGERRDIGARWKSFVRKGDKNLRNINLSDHLRPAYFFVAMTWEAMKAGNCVWILCDEKQRTDQPVRIVQASIEWASGALFLTWLTQALTLAIRARRMHGTVHGFWVGNFLVCSFYQGDTYFSSTTLYPSI